MTSTKTYFRGKIECEDKKSSPYDEELYVTNTDEMNDQYLAFKVPISWNDTTQESTTLCRKRNSEGTLIGTKDTNPIIDTRVHEVPRRIKI